MVYIKQTFNTPPKYQKGQLQFGYGHCVCAIILILSWWKYMMVNKKDYPFDAYILGLVYK